MDPTLSFLMANMAGVNDTSIVLDPFVGTGEVTASWSSSLTLLKQLTSNTNMKILDLYNHILLTFETFNSCHLVLRAMTSSLTNLSPSLTEHAI